MQILCQMPALGEKWQFSFAGAQGVPQSRVYRQSTTKLTRDSDFIKYRQRFITMH